MGILEAIGALRDWFLRNNIKIDPDKFEVVLRFKDMREYAHFEYAARNDVHSAMYAYLNKEPTAYRQFGRTAEIMGVKIVAELPGERSCDTCAAIRKAGWRAP